MEKLELGMGIKRHPGYTTVDIRPEVKPDFIGDFRTMTFCNLDEVRSHHLFEHFSREESLEVLKQWNTWLKPKGQLVIETPDFEGICRDFHKDPYWMTRHAYGSQESDWAFHKDGWYEDKFKEILPKVGFTLLSVRKTCSRKILPNITILAEKNG